MLDISLLPSVALVEPNFSYDNEIWSLVVNASYDKRYWLYGRWKSVHAASQLDLKLQAGKVRGRMNYLMK